jgi:hypothetical protein
VIHPLLVFALLIGGIAYANHVLTVKPKRERTKTTAEMLGLRADADVQGSLSAFPFALLERPPGDDLRGDGRGGAARRSACSTWRRSRPSRWRAPAHRDGSPCLAPLSVDTPHLIVEPEAFLTPSVDRPHLPTVSVGHDRSTARTTSDPRTRVRGVVRRRRCGDVAARAERGCGVRDEGACVLLYRAWIPAKDRDVLLDVLRRFLDAVAARGSTVDP